MNRIGRYQLEGRGAGRRTPSAGLHRQQPTGAPSSSAFTTACSRSPVSPVVAINRAVAIAEIEGAQAGLAALDEQSADARLSQYQPWWAARAELLAQLRLAMRRRAGTPTSKPSASNPTQRSAASSKAGRQRCTSVAVQREAALDLGIGTALYSTMKLYQPIG